MCDDDHVVRSVVTDLVEGRGGEVIAETERSADVVVLAERFRPDVVILDLGLELGSGLDVLAHFATRDDAPHIIVFTAFDGVVDAPAATRIIRKPGFRELERALDGVGRLQAQDADRRRPVRARPAPTARDVLGVDEAVSFYELLVGAEPDDALLALSTDGLDPVDAVVAVREVLRTDDRLTQRRQWLVAFLPGGGTTGARAVVDRLSDAIPDVSDRVRTAPAGVDPAQAFIDLTA